VLLALVERVGQRDNQEMLAVLVQLVFRELKVHLVFRELKVRPEFKALADQLVSQVQLELKVIKELVVFKAQVAFKVFKVFKEPADHLV
jgi:hypothetical protein